MFFLNRNQIETKRHKLKMNVDKSTSRNDLSFSIEKILEFRDETIERKKKSRTTFSRTQIFHLETTFEQKPYLSNVDRTQLAENLRLTDQQIKVKEKKTNRIRSNVFRLDLVSKSSK